MILKRIRIVKIKATSRKGNNIQTEKTILPKIDLTPALSRFNMSIKMENRLIMNTTCPASIISYNCLSHSETQSANFMLFRLSTNLSFINGIASNTNPVPC